CSSGWSRLGGWIVVRRTARHCQGGDDGGGGGESDHGELPRSGGHQDPSKSHAKNQGQKTGAEPYFQRSEACGNRALTPIFQPSKNSLTFSSQPLARGLWRPLSALLIDSNSRSSWRWRSVSCTGVSTTTWQKRSPCTWLRTPLIPLPFSRNCLPLCVSAGTRMRAGPSRAGIPLP